MQFIILTVTFLLWMQGNPNCHCFDLSSITSAVTKNAGIAGRFIYENSMCKFKECCDKVHIPADFEKLKNDLNKRLYGQPFVETVVDTLQSHWGNPQPKKALTLSFHGSWGTGKTYVSEFIISAIYSHGSKSNYVHRFTSGVHFPNNEKVDDYKINLYEIIKGNVSICPYQLFIFDEVHNMPPGVLDVLRPLVDYNDNVEKVDYRRCVFIFISNVGAQLILQKTLDSWKAGKSRNELEISSFHRPILTNAYNEDCGFYHSSIIRSELIDQYIPFLPLEIDHVKLCIEDVFEQYGIFYPKEQHLQEILDYITWGPEPENKYSNVGCKSVSQKVYAIIYKWYPKARKEEL